MHVLTSILIPCSAGTPPSSVKAVPFPSADDPAIIIYPRHHVTSFLSASDSAISHFFLPFMTTWTTAFPGIFFGRSYSFLPGSGSGTALERRRLLRVFGGGVPSEVLPPRPSDLLMLMRNVFPNLLKGGPLNLAWSVRPPFFLLDDPLSRKISCSSAITTFLARPRRPK